MDWQWVMRAHPITYPRKPRMTLNQTAVTTTIAAATATAAAKRWNYAIKQSNWIEISSLSTYTIRNIYYCVWCTCRTICERNSMAFRPIEIILREPGSIRPCDTHLKWLFNCTDFRRQLQWWCIIMYAQTMRTFNIKCHFFEWIMCKGHFFFYSELFGEFSMIWKGWIREGPIEMEHIANCVIREFKILIQTNQ